MTAIRVRVAWGSIRRRKEIVMIRLLAVLGLAGILMILELGLSAAVQ
jgi:hypothetical protein